MIKFSTFALIILGVPFLIWMLKVDLDENQKLHEPKFKIVEKIEIDTSKSMDLNKIDSVNLINS
jgi:hypothetical protein